MKKYSSAEQDGTLYLIILMDEILTSNENSLTALEGTIKIYSIASDGKDNLRACIKLIRAVCKTIIVMRDGGSHRTPLPKRFVVSLIKVFQATSVEPFNEKIVQFHNSMEFQRFGDDNNDTYNDEVTLEKLFKFAMTVLNELFNDGV